MMRPGKIKKYIIFLVLAALITSALAFISWIAYGQQAGSDLSFAVSTSVKDNGINSVVKILKEKEASLQEKEQVLKDRETAVGDKKNNIYLIILAGGSALLALIVLNFYLDYQHKKKNQ